MGPGRPLPCGSWRDSGFSRTALTFIIGIIGTTIAPWQLFFQQGSVVDKKIVARFTFYERLDTAIGSAFTNAQGAALVVAGAMTFAGTRYSGGQLDVLHLALEMAGLVNPALGTVFVVILLNAAMIGAATVTLASAYAVGDLFGVKASLNAPLRKAKGFYLSYTTSVVTAAGIVLVPHLPLGAINFGVQVLAGILLSNSLGYLMLLSNDRELLGPWTNPPFLNMIAVFIAGGLFALSIILTIAFLWPAVDVPLLILPAGIMLLATAVAIGVSQRMRAGHWGPSPGDRRRRPGWVTPPAALERPMRPSRLRNAVLGILRA